MKIEEMDRIANEIAESTFKALHLKIMELSVDGIIKNNIFFGALIGMISNAIINVCESNNIEIEQMVEKVIKSIKEGLNI